jgi:hypothetical protein
MNQLIRSVVDARPATRASRGIGILAVAFALTLTACSESTAPNQDLLPDYAKGGNSGGTSTPSPNDYISTFDGTVNLGIAGGIAGTYVEAGTSAKYGKGSCGAEGEWTNPAGEIVGVGHPHCLAYRSAGAGNNGKGTCTTSKKKDGGWPGAWINTQGKETAPYHPNCLLGDALGIQSLGVRWVDDFTIYTDNSGKQANFGTGGGVNAGSHLHYSAATNITSGTGLINAGDDGLGDATWSIDLEQSPLNSVLGEINGDQIGLLTTGGQDVIVCSALKAQCYAAHVTLTLTAK